MRIGGWLHSPALPAPDPTHSSELPDTQLVAFKGIVMLITRYIGLRHLFLAVLSSASMPRPSRAAICELWRSGSEGGDQEWNFFLEYAAYCISASNDITRTIEAIRPSRFGLFEEGLCVTNRISNCITK